MGSFKVFVPIFTDYICTLKVESSTTINDLVRKITTLYATRNSLDLSQIDCMLLFRGRNLLDNPSSTLEQCGIKDQDELPLSQKGTFNIRVVRGAPESSMLFQVEALETVKELKVKIHGEMGFAVEDLDLYYCYSIMDDDEASLANYGVYNRKGFKNPEEEFVYDILIGFGPDKESLPVYFENLIRCHRATPDRTITVECAASIGTVILSIHINGEETIDILRRKILEKLNNDERQSPVAYVPEELYKMIFKRKILEDGSLTLDQSDIQNHDKIMVCPSVQFTVLVVFVRTDAEILKKKVHSIPVMAYDTVGNLKKKIRTLEGLPSEQKIIMKREHEWMTNDESCLLEYGVVIFPLTEDYKYSYSDDRKTCLIEALSYDGDD